MDATTLGRLDDRLRAKRETFNRIPVIDIGPLLDGSDKQGVARQIRWALSNVGFMYIRNHAVAQDLIDAMFSAGRNFFALPLEEKMKVHVSTSGMTLRGYIELFGENTNPGKTLDYKEVFDLGPECAEAESPFFGPNPWPAGHDRFRKVAYDYHETMVMLARTMLRGIALSLDLEETFFEGLMRKPISIQRLLYYPPQAGQIREDIIGVGAHSDYGNMTILAQDNVGGLQVMNRDGDWIEATPIPGTFVINIGDLIQKLTNDLYIANLHRVINISGRERYSIPFFIDADYDAVIEPLPSCVSESNPARYEPVTCGAYKFARFKATYPHLADPIA